MWTSRCVLTATSYRLRTPARQPVHSVHCRPILYHLTNTGCVDLKWCTCDWQLSLSCQSSTQVSDLIFSWRKRTRCKVAKESKSMKRRLAKYEISTEIKVWSDVFIEGWCGVGAKTDLVRDGVEMVQELSCWRMRQKLSCWGLVWEGFSNWVLEGWCGNWVVEDRCKNLGVDGWFKTWVLRKGCKNWVVEMRVDMWQRSRLVFISLFSLGGQHELECSVHSNQRDRPLPLYLF